MKKMAVAGAGAVGSVLGGYISKAGEDITLIDPWLEHVQAMRQSGLRIDGARGEHLIKVKALHTDEIQQLEDKFDILFISVKSYDTERILAVMKPYLKRDAWVVSCQNGINEDVIATIVGRLHTVGCVVTMGAELREAGHVTEVGKKTAFAVGELDGQITPRIQEIAKIVGLCAETEVTTNLFGKRWAKLALNSMGNALAAITGYGAQQLHKDERVRRIFQFIAAETVQVAEALGYEVEPILGISAELWKKSAERQQLEIEDALVNLGRILGNRRLSLVQDLTRGRPTEIDYLNGYAARRGREVGIPTPINAAIVDLVKKLESGRLEAGPANIDILWKMIPK